jgi:hypothetical protein
VKEVEMFELFVASEAARDKIRGSVEPTYRPQLGAPTAKHDRRRLTTLRSTSAAVLRRLAERLEPSPTA